MGLGCFAIGTNLVDLKRFIATPAKVEKTKADLKQEKEDALTAMFKASEASGQPVVSDTGKLMVWHGKTYVKIENDWFEERADHTYLVKGVKTYFIDNSRVGTEQPKRGLAEIVETADDKATSILEKMSKNPFSAYSAEQVTDMMQAVQEAKTQAAERDKALKELSRSQ